MRRLFVVFLILLFPLNVVALSLSASPVMQDGVPAPAGATLAAADDRLDLSASAMLDGQGGADIDSDEPPASGDFHESMDEAGRLGLPLRAAAPGLPYTPPLHVHPSFAPVKPPPRG